MYGRNVDITWNEEGCSYSWTAKIVVEDVIGATKGQNFCNDMALKTGFFHEQTIEYDEWEISGSGQCPK